MIDAALCNNPNALSAGALLAYAAGSASPAVAAHVKGCPLCAARAAELRLLGATLRVALERVDCPAPATLVDFHLNQLPPSQKLAVALHIRRCRACTRELALLSAPDEGNWVGGWFGQIFAPIQRVLSAQPLPLDGQRPGTVRGRPLLRQIFAAGSLHVHVACAAGAGGHGQLSGLLLAAGSEPEPLAEVEVSLAQDDKALATQRASLLGHFVFEDLGPGYYGLLLTWQDTLVIVDGVGMERSFVSALA